MRDDEEDALRSVREFDQALTSGKRGWFNLASVSVGEVDEVTKDAHDGDDDGEPLEIEPWSLILITVVGCNVAYFYDILLIGLKKLIRPDYVFINSITYNVKDHSIDIEFRPNAGETAFEIAESIFVIFNELFDGRDLTVRYRTGGDFILYHDM